MCPGLILLLKIYDGGSGGSISRVSENGHHIYFLLLDKSVISCHNNAAQQAASEPEMHMKMNSFCSQIYGFLGWFC